MFSDLSEGSTRKAGKPRPKHFYFELFSEKSNKLL